MPGGATQNADDVDDDQDQGDYALPSDQELAAYFRETWDADGRDAPTWLEYFDFEDAPSRKKRQLDDRVRDFFVDHLTVADE